MSTTSITRLSYVFQPNGKQALLFEHIVRVADISPSGNDKAEQNAYNARHVRCNNGFNLVAESSTPFLQHRAIDRGMMQINAAAYATKVCESDGIHSTARPLV